MGAQLPWRIELFDQEIESIRSFDADSQRSAERVDSVRMLPAREYPFDDDAIRRFRRTFRLRFEIDTRHCPLYQDLRQGIHPQGLEYYLPLFFSNTVNILQYLKSTPRLVLQQGVADAAGQFLAQAPQGRRQRQPLPRRDLGPLLLGQRS